MPIRSLSFSLSFFAAQTWKMNYGIYTVATPISRAIERKPILIYFRRRRWLSDSPFVSTVSIFKWHRSAGPMNTFVPCAYTAGVRVGSAAKVARACRHVCST